jgi:hypothetical protein
MWKELELLLYQCLTGGLCRKLLFLIIAGLLADSLLTREVKNKNKNNGLRKMIHTKRADKSPE